MTTIDSNRSGPAAGAPSVRTNVIANFLGRGWTGLLGVICLPIYAHLIGIEAQGVIGLFVSLQVVLGILDLGLSSTLNRELARSAGASDLSEARDLVRTLEIVYWGIAFFIALTLAMVGPVFANNWLNAGSLSANVIGIAAMLLGLQIAVQFPQSLYNGGLMGLEKQVMLNAITSVIHLGRFVGVFLPLLLIRADLITFVAWQILVLFMGTIWIRWYLWRSLAGGGHKPKFRVESLRRTGRFTLGVSATALVTLPLTMTDKLLLSHTLSLEAFGYYMLAFQGASALGVIVGPFYKAYLPRFSRVVAEKDDDHELCKIYRLGSQSLAVVLAPAASTAIVFAFPMVGIWLHQHEEHAISLVAPVFAVLMAGNYFNALMNLPYALTLAKGWTRFGFLQNLMASAIYLPMLYYTTMVWGALGAAIAWCVLNFGYVIISAPLLYRKMLPGFYGEWIKFGVGLPASVALGFLGAVWLLLPEGLSSIWQLVWIGGGAALAVCGVALSLPGLRAVRRDIAVRLRLPFVFWAF